MLVAALGVVWLWLALGGAQVFAGEPPREGDPEVVAAERATVDPLVAQMEEDTAEVVVPVLGEQAAPLGRGLTRMPCVQGQHNWKVDDDFDLSCEVQAVEVVGLESRADFRAEMTRLDAALLADGWTASEHNEMSWVLTDYWDVLGPPGDGGPGQARGASPQLGDYSMQNLPSARYHRHSEWGGGSRRDVLEVGWVERRSGPDGVSFYDDWTRWQDPDGRDVEQRELVRTVPRRGYAVVLTRTVEYFRE